MNYVSLQLPASEFLGGPSGTQKETRMGQGQRVVEELRSRAHDHLAAGIWVQAKMFFKDLYQMELKTRSNNCLLGEMGYCLGMKK